MFEDDGDLLSDGFLMGIHEVDHLPLHFTLWYFLVLFRLLENLEIPLVGRVVLKDIQGESFLDGLNHRVGMEGIEMTLLVLPTEQFQRLVLGGTRESEEGDVVLFSSRLNLLSNHLLVVLFPLFTFTHRKGLLEVFRGLSGL